MTMLEIRIAGRTITLWGHHAEQLVAFLLAAAVLVPWLIARIWW